MKKNVGKTDKTIRLVVVLIIAVLFILGKLTLASTLGIILAIIGVVFLFTALANWCALYQLVGLSTCAKKTA